MSAWLVKGENIILAIDLNEDMRKGNYTEKLKNIGLYESIIELHEKEEIQPTYNRGQTPIDSLFLSHSIIEIAGGYLLFSKVPSDHRVLWIKTRISLSFGYKFELTPSFIARWIKCNNLQVVQCFQELYKAFLLENGLYQRIYKIQKAISAG